MKSPKISLFRIGASLVAFSVASFTYAQPADAPSGEKAEKAERAEKGGGRRGGGDQLPRLKERLKLTDEQVAKLEPIFAEQRAQMQKLADLPQEERRAKARELNEATSTKVVPILTAEQAAEFKAMREEMGRRGKGGEGKGDKAKAKE